MISLLIHNSKLPDIVVKKFTRNIILTPSEAERNESDFDYDVFYHEKLSELFKDGQDYQIIYISLSLSDSDYLEMNGLRVAHHIRLTKKWNHQFTPIYFVCQESIDEIMRVNPLGNILLTNGINITIDLKNFQIQDRAPLTQRKYDRYLNKVSIEAPSNFQSHHSIANEWALFRYYSSFQPDKENKYYQSLGNKINRLEYLKTLHFKYIEAKVSRQQFKPNKHTISPYIKDISNKKIGIIDDEISKGWLDFYNYVLNKSSACAVPYTDFKKGDTREVLINKIKDWISDEIQKVDPVDIFVIDLRLHDDDFSEKDFDNLSGIQIIQYIKSKNPGIQIVLCTASNKVWNFQKSLEYGVTNFVVKESPETYSSRKETERSLQLLFSQLSNTCRNAFLAELFRSIQHLKQSNIFKDNQKVSEFQQVVFGQKGILDKLYNLLLLDNTNETILNQCLLLCFQVLENYCDLSSVSNFGKSKIINNKLSSGFVWQRAGKQIDIFCNRPNGEILTRIELTFGKFNFQSKNSNGTPVSFKINEKLLLSVNRNLSLDASSIVKMISVLYFRDTISREDIEKLMKLRYYRSNIAAHLTGNIKPDYQRISAKDIVFFIQIFKQIFI